MEIIKVNDNCIQCGSCMGCFPEIFEANDEGFAQVIEGEECQKEEDAETYVNICPVEAITSTPAKEEK